MKDLITFPLIILQLALLAAAIASPFYLCITNGFIIGIIGGCIMYFVFITLAAFVVQIIEEIEGDK